MQSDLTQFLITQNSQQRKPKDQIDRSTSKRNNLSTKMKQLIRNLVFHLKTFHSNRCYIIFQILQLTLALVIIIRALTSVDHFKTPDVMIMQYILLSLMYIDMAIRIAGLGIRAVLKGKGNIIDVVILVIFTITIISLTVIQKQSTSQSSKTSSEIPNQIAQNTKAGENQEYQKILQTDDIIIITVVMVRYIIQIIRTVLTIRNTQKNIEIDKQIKAIDLNNSDSIGHNNSTIIDEQIQKDQAVKLKMMRLKNKKSIKENNSNSARKFAGQQPASQQQNKDMSDKKMGIQLQQIRIDDSI